MPGIIRQPRASAPVLDPQFVHGTRPWVARHTDPAYQAIRGREQQMIDALGGSWAEVGRGGTMSGNAIRGVAKANPLGRVYHTAATVAFGQIALYTGY
jgi:hypothetical protein